MLTGCESRFALATSASQFATCALGMCCCVQFIVDLLPEAAASSAPSVQAIEALVLVLLVPYVLFVRRLDLLAHFMSAANLLVLFALTLILVYCIKVFASMYEYSTTGTCAIVLLY